MKPILHHRRLVAVLAAAVVGTASCSADNETKQQPDAGTAITCDTNPFRAQELRDLAADLKAAVQGRGTPATTPLAVVPNCVDPFWTPCQIGAGRASQVLGAPMTFLPPTGADETARLPNQQSIINGLVDDGYKGISLSAIGGNALDADINAGVAAGTTFITMDSDAPSSERTLYIGTDNFNAGKKAGEAMVGLLGSAGGKVAALTGSVTAQNAHDRIEGFKAAIAGTAVTLVEVYNDEGSASTSATMAAQALTDHTDLAGFYTVWGYNGPAAGNAVKNAGKGGQIKIVAFDLAPETLAFMEEGVVTAAIGQRPYWFCNLSVYVLYALHSLGETETKAVMGARLSGPNADMIDSGIDVVRADQMDLYNKNLECLGISSN